MTDPDGVYDGGLEQLDWGYSVGEKEEKYSCVVWKTQGDYCEYGRGSLKEKWDDILNLRERKSWFLASGFVWSTCILISKDFFSSSTNDQLTHKRMH